MLLDPASVASQNFPSATEKICSFAHLLAVIFPLILFFLHHPFPSQMPSLFTIFSPCYVAILARCWKGKLRLAWVSQCPAKIRTSPKWCGDGDRSGGSGLGSLLLKLLVIQQHWSDEAETCCSLQAVTLVLCLTLTGQATRSAVHSLQPHVRCTASALFVHGFVDMLEANISHPAFVEQWPVIIFC